MGDTGEAFKLFNEYKAKKRAIEQPKRLLFAKQQLDKNKICFRVDGDLIKIFLENGFIEFWPYSGWFCGRNPYGRIKGRGIEKLLKAIENERNNPKI